MRGQRSLRVTNPSWNPKSESTLRFWMDATDDSTLTVDGSNRVSAWVDKSANAYSFAQATDLKKPVKTAAAINGLQALAINGTVQGLIGPANAFVATNAAWTIGFVGQITGYNGNTGEFLHFTDGTKKVFKLALMAQAQGDGYRGFCTAISDSSYALCQYQANIAGTTTFKVIVSYTGSSPTSTGSYEIWWNGVSRTIATNSGGWGTGLALAGTAIGITDTDANFGMAGYVCEVNFFDSRSAGLTSRLNGYYTRWNV